MIDDFDFSITGTKGGLAIRTEWVYDHTKIYQDLHLEAEVCCCCKLCGIDEREGDLKGEIDNDRPSFKGVPGEPRFDGRSCCSCRIGLDWDLHRVVGCCCEWWSMSKMHGEVGMTFRWVSILCISFVRSGTRYWTFSWSDLKKKD
jgi:hypothetical protein